MSENRIDPEELDKACRWNAFVVHLHSKYSYLLNFELAIQIAHEAQDYFEDGAVQG